jgi:predicted dehydrogenase
MISNKTKNINLSVVGCGNIAEFHIPVMREAGFNIVAIAGSLDSKNVTTFAKKHNIPKTYSNPIDLIENFSEWDALLLLSPTSSIVSYLNLVASCGKPILAEKPVALNHLDLESLIHFKNIRVAYNRRFYSGSVFAKKFVASHPNSLIKVTIPENRKDPDHNINFPKRLPLLSYENSVHIFDLMRFISHDISWEKTSIIKNNQNYVGLISIGTGSNGSTIQLDSYYNASENFAINIISDDERLEMKPLEITSFYKGMSVIEPSEETPIRIYSPSLKNQIIDSQLNGFKPGFFGQAQDFMKFCLNNEDCSGADIIDAYYALKLVHSLLE